MSINIADVKNKIYAISATNRNPIYDSHIYWSQKPYNICDILIESFSSQGDTVFDPFWGSGVTLLQSITKKHKRKAIGCEINEAPLFIVQTLLMKYNLQRYNEVLKCFLEQIRQLQNYYFTVCPICNSKTAVITSVIFDKESRDSEIKIKKINYRCGCSSKCSKEPDKSDYVNINIIHSLANISDLEMIPDTKIAVYENQTISKIFTNRNFAVLEEVIGIINKLDDFTDLFKYILMSVLHLCKITDKHSNSQWPLWIPKIDCVEKNVIDILVKKSSKFLSAIKYLSEHYDESPSYKLLHKGSQNIIESDIANDSVQLIITDPCVIL
ncbi:MAG: site-specific DNA-methyltransferase [Oscillospiraceae bacterium]|nr:site-specific DNA-methyltransferase [Oscillospiraceae bacterium]